MRKMFSKNQIIEMIGEEIEKTLPENFDADIEWVESVSKYLNVSEISEGDYALYIDGNLHIDGQLMLYGGFSAVLNDNKDNLQDMLDKKQDKLYQYAVSFETSQKTYNYLSFTSTDDHQVGMTTLSVLKRAFYVGAVLLEDSSNIAVVTFVDTTRFVYRINNSDEVSVNFTDIDETAIQLDSKKEL